jgi:hypothetical protein
MIEAAKLGLKVSGHDIRQRGRTLMKPKLFIGRSDRLIARLRSLLYAWRFIDQINGQLFVKWTTLPERYGDEALHYSPFHIFDLMKFSAEGGSDRLQFLQTNAPFPDDSIRLDDAKSASSWKSGFDRSTFATDYPISALRGTAKLRFSDEPGDNAYIFAGIQHLFRQLPVHPRILQSKEAFYARTDLEPGLFDAIHVRRGDVFDMLDAELPGWPSGNLSDDRFDLLIGHYVGRTSPFEFYLPAVRKALAGGRKIIFSSDSPEVIDQFRSEFGPSSFIDLSKAKMKYPIQKAFLDFLILCDANTLIGTSSNFSMMPAELGGTNLINVAGLGAFDIVEQHFHDRFLCGPQLSHDTVTEARRRLARIYGEFSARRMLQVKTDPGKHD